MAIIDDYLEKLRADLVVTLALVAGGEDSLDIAAGESTLTADTVNSETAAFTYLKERRNWLWTQIAALDDALSKGFDEIPAFDITQGTAEEIALKQKQMLDFSKLLRPVVPGADGGFFSVSEIQPAAAPLKKTRK